MRKTKIIPPILEMKKVKVGVITHTDWVLEPWLGVATEWRKERHTDTKTTKLDRGASNIQPSLLTTSVYLVDTAEGEGLAGLCRGLCTQAISDCKYSGRGSCSSHWSIIHKHAYSNSWGRVDGRGSFVISLEPGPNCFANFPYINWSWSPWQAMPMSNTQALKTSLGACSAPCID